MLLIVFIVIFYRGYAPHQCDFLPRLCSSLSLCPEAGVHPWLPSRGRAPFIRLHNKNKSSCKSAVEREDFGQRDLPRSDTLKLIYIYIHVSLPSIFNIQNLIKWNKKKEKWTHLSSSGLWRAYIAPYPFGSLSLSFGRSLPCYRMCLKTSLLL